MAKRKEYKVIIESDTVNLVGIKFAHSTARKEGYRLIRTLCKENQTEYNKVGQEYIKTGSNYFSVWCEHWQCFKTGETLKMSIERL